MTEFMEFDVDGLDPEIVAEAKRISARKQNASPWGPRSVRKPLTGRKLRRAMGEINREPARLTISVEWQSGSNKGFTTQVDTPSKRAIKRINCARGHVR